MKSSLSGGSFYSKGNSTGRDQKVIKPSSGNPFLTKMPIPGVNAYT